MTTRHIDRIRFVTRHFTELQGLRASALGLMIMSQGISQFFRSGPVALVCILVCMLVCSGAMIVVLRAKSYYRRAFGEVVQQPVLVDVGLPSVYSPAGPAPLEIERWPARRITIPILLACALFLVLRATLPTAILLTDGSGIDPWVQLHPPILVLEKGPSLPRSMDEQTLILGQSLYVLYGSVLLAIWFWRERRLSQSYYLAFGAPLLGLGMLSASLGGVVSAFPGAPRFISFLLPALAHFWMPLLLCGGTMFLCGLLDHLQIVRALRPALEEPA